MSTKKVTGIVTNDNDNNPSAATSSNNNNAMPSYPQVAGDAASDEPILSNNNGDIENATSPHGGGSSGKSYFCTYKFAELLLCFIPVPIGVFLEFASPYERPIPYYTIEELGTTIKGFMYDNEFKGETVSPVVMFACAFLIPCFVQVLLIFFRRLGERDELLHKTACVYVASLGLTQTLTNFAKLYVGYLRPIFFKLCQPSEDMSTCTSSDGLAADGHQARVSFFSGHTSLSFSGLLAFCLFLEHFYGKTAYERRKQLRNSAAEPIKLTRIATILCYTPMLVAYFIGLSRVHDNEHHPADVIAGAIVGSTVSYTVFNIWFN